MENESYIVGLLLGAIGVLGGVCIFLYKDRNNTIDKNIDFMTKTIGVFDKVTDLKEISSEVKREITEIKVSMASNKCGYVVKH